MTGIRCLISASRRASEFLAVLALAAVLSGADAGAQEETAATGVVPITPLLTLDQDQMFAGSAFGQRIIADLERDRNALAAENRRIEQQLTAEELELTEKRGSMPAAEFAQLAAEFDTRVQNFRQTQDRKAQVLQNRLDAERQRFAEQAGPVLADIARDRGAVAILDNTLVLMSFDVIDVTEEAITRLDAAIGDGQSLLGSPSVSEPRSSPDPSLRPRPRAVPDLDGGTLSPLGNELPE